MSESIYTLRVSRVAAGAYPTISDALAAADQLYPDTEQPVMIRVEPGEYRERVEIRRPHVTIEGETADSVRIMGGLGAKMPSEDGSGVDGTLSTFRTYTVLVDADDVTLANLRSKTMRAMGARSVRRLPCMPMATVWLSMPAALRGTRTHCFWVRCRRMRPNRAGS